MYVVHTFMKLNKEKNTNEITIHSDAVFLSVCDWCNSHEKKDGPRSVKYLV